MLYHVLEFGDITWDVHILNRKMHIGNPCFFEFLQLVRNAQPLHLLRLNQAYNHVYFILVLYFLNIFGEISPLHGPCVILSWSHGHTQHSFPLVFYEVNFVVRLCFHDFFIVYKW